MIRNTCFIAFVAFVAFSLPTAFGQGNLPSIRSGHNLLQDTKESSLQPGTKLPDLSFRDLQGKSHYLKQLTKNRPVVFVFLSTTCPLAKQYTMRINRIQATYGKQISIYAVFPNSDETRNGIREYHNAAGFAFPAVHDVDGYLTDKLNATMTPQSFLVDTSNVLRFRGAIDDHRYANRVKFSYLRNAIDAVLSSRPLAISVAKSMGCNIHRDDTAPNGEVTYSRHIARILQNKCMSCHRKGQVAPFPLSNYAEAKRWKTEIQEYTQARLMPPWKASPGFADYKNDTSLSARQISLINNWVKQGAPQGNPDEIPPTPIFNDEWEFGEPDLVVEMQENYILGAEGEDDYRHFIIPYAAKHQRFIKAIDVRPGNRSVVHHVIAYFDTSGKARELDSADPGPGYTRFGDVGFRPASILGGWAPGSQPTLTPEGSGRWLPQKGDIVLQVHYYRTGFQESDRTKIGLYFQKDLKTVPARSAMVINKNFVIPANKSNVQVTAKFELKEDSLLYSVTPHMHLVGKKIKVTAETPSGKTINLVKIDDWDFNWQATYYFKELLSVPKGTIFHLVANFDNSEANPNNPNSPPLDIGWGEKTTDEMCIAFLGLLRKSEYQPILDEKRNQASGQLP